MEGINWCSFKFFSNWCTKTTLKKSYRISSYSVEMNITLFKY